MPWAKALRPFSIALVLSSGACAAIVATSGADAGERQRDRIYADSFGNLVVYSRAGYKRIVVGQGHLAEELTQYTGSGDTDPNVISLDDGQDAYVECYRPPGLWKGRSYMYGLEDGEVPQPSGSCFSQ
jgi:ABC-type Fe3+-hydroxamate transport system substrate-binding protein